MIKFINKINQNIFHGKIKSERRILSFLKEYHIYNIVKNSYGFLKGKK